MRVPQVTERMKEAPAQALRAVFAGIGQVLLVADRIRNRPADGEGAPSGASPQPAGEALAATAEAPAPAPPETPAAAQAPAAQPAAKAPAAKPADARPSAAKAPAAKAPAVKASAPARPSAAAQAPAEAAEAPPAGAPAADGLPLASYDELPIASLRARMRSLDTAQLRALVDYESTHAGRAAVLAMFERRIAKLEGGEA